MKLHTITAGLLLSLAAASCKKDKKEAPPPPDVMPVWQFTAGGKTYSGVFREAAFVESAGGRLSMTGAPPGGNADTLFDLAVQFRNGKIEPGIYQTNDAGTSFSLAKLPEGKVIFAANVTSAPQSGIPGQVVFINISAYDPQTGIITGTFSGDSYDTENKTVPVSKGAFSLAVKR